MYVYIIAVMPLLCQCPVRPVLYGPHNTGLLLGGASPTPVQALQFAPGGTTEKKQERF